ncbi:unnamed protein product [Brachionus calyciflorus]|uniref:Uncharacterized protein n=1 Tax=Brachionus calyciflorus TaxID=104777 RepID=A0A813X007_9BILA|nr:unnamed protein product [Brachionus calyciflorus]
MQVTQSIIQHGLFLVHFVLAVLAMSSFVLPNGYLISQAIIIGLNFWSFIEKEKSEPFYLLSSVTFFTFFTDIIIIAINWTSNQGFQLAMGIIMIFVKPIIFYLALNSGRERDGVAGVGMPSFGNWGSPQTNFQTEQQHQQQNYQSSQQFTGGYQNQ